jgi:SAM-dependent methyltransferase
MTGENNWFETDKGQALAAQGVSACASWLWPLCGHNALVLQPCAQGLALPALQCEPVYQVQRARGRFYGDIIAEDARLPLVNECMALVLAAFVMETAGNPEALIAECERVLVPDGHFAILALNPFAPARLSGVWSGMHLETAATWSAMSGEAGLELIRHEKLGKARPRALCSVNFLLLRKRKAALTPLRKNASAVALAREQTPT